MPQKGAQVQRFGPQLANLANALARQKAVVTVSPGAAEPEKVLVFEIVGYVDTFVKALPKAGLEWLMDLRAYDIEADDDFYLLKPRDGGRAARETVDGRLFFTMTDQNALQQMMSLWKLWENDQPFPRGFTPWRDVFAQLRAVRYWEAQDRLAGTGLEKDWELRVTSGEKTVPLEIELWYRADRTRREDAQRRVSALVQGCRGDILASAMIDEIRYHAIAARIPAADAPSFLGEAGHDIGLVRCDDVMFFRPTGQVVTITPPEDAIDETRPAEAEVPSGDPVALLLDGMPMQRHSLLARHVLVDDPDDWSADYPVRARQHGTAMASLIVNGDLSGGRMTIRTPLLVRPVMLPGPEDFNGNTVETIPDGVLPADLIRRSIVRIFEGDDGEAPVAPGIRVVNLSLGDAARPFARTVSPWARCLDWLSHRYGVLFVVSAGNNVDDLELDLPRNCLSDIDSDGRCKAFVLAGVKDHVNRGLLSPAESLNALTVGAVDADWCGDVALPNGFCEAHPSDGRLPSPIGRYGLGYRRTVKPDIVNYGGRAVFSEHLAHGGQNAVARLRRSRRAPGLKAATPPTSSAVAAATCHSIGTSNAAALTTRAAVLLFSDVVQPILDSPGRLPMSRRHQSVMLKTLLGHSARWPADVAKIADVLAQAGMDGRQTRLWRTRLCGYGLPDLERVVSCTDQRATLLGWSDIDPDEAHVYHVPIPPSLSGRHESIRLTTTVGWFTPINPRHQEYRRAALSLEFPEMAPREIFGAAGADVDHDACGRGTLLHRVLEGRRATAFGDDDFLEIRIDCRAPAGDLDDSVPYAMAVTLEVAEESDVPIYEEVRARVGVPVTVAAHQAT